MFLLHLLMHRALRVEFEDAVYHVMARGNERRPTFHDDTDDQRFLNSLSEADERFSLALA